MCGIAGIVDFSGTHVTEDLLWRMTKTLRHRGPDDSGVYVDGPAGLGHTRLSIIDLSAAGHQPMVTEDGEYILVYNGEIYNFEELRQQLEKKDVVFYGRSDSEVVLKAYVTWGADAFKMFKGMFSIAIWDRQKQHLYAARDRFGIKPFYYFPLTTGCVFGSEVKAILASDRMDRGVNIGALHEYLYYGAALGERSCFSGVKKLLPGYLMKVDCTGLNTTPYASIYDLDQLSDDMPRAVSETRERLEKAVGSHLVSDVPVGVFLSGGIDSSTITALASKQYSGRLKTFSVGFDYEHGVNELQKARELAQHFDTDHHELHVKGEDLPNVIESLVLSHDEPFGDAADIPLYLLCRELKGSVKVVLQGDGGDEIFAGYRRYGVLAYGRAWSWLMSLAETASRVLPSSPTVNRVRRFAQALSHPDPAIRMALLLTQESLEPPPTRILTADAVRAVEAHDPFARYRDFESRFPNLDPVQQMLYTDCGIILPDIFLEKVDKATMAHGIEVRVPLLDADLAHYVMGLPSSLKVRRGQKKWLLRCAMRGIVPDKILDGKKTGFGVPYAWWLREPLAEYLRSVLLDEGTLDWGVLDRHAMERCIDEHVRGVKNNGFLLYKVLLLALWYRLRITGESC